MHLPDAWGYVVFADEAVDLVSCGAVVMGFEAVSIEWRVLVHYLQFVYDLESNYMMLYGYSLLSCYVWWLDGELCLTDFLALVASWWTGSWSKNSLARTEDGCNWTVNVSSGGQTFRWQWCKGLLSGVTGGIFRWWTSKTNSILERTCFHPCCFFACVY